MRDLTRSWFNPIGNVAIEREVEEELRFHLEMLEQHFRQASSSADARASALRRFGSVEQVKDQCVEISKRKHPFIRALKSFLILTFLAGIFVRIVATDFHVDRVGGVMIMIAVMARLFLYVRGLRPSGFRPKPDTSSPLMLNGSTRTPTSLFDADNL